MEITSLSTKVGVRYAYALPSLDPTCGITPGYVVSYHCNHSENVFLNKHSENVIKLLNLVYFCIMMDKDRFKCNMFSKDSYSYAQAIF